MRRLSGSLLALLSLTVGLSPMAATMGASVENHPNIRKAYNQLRVAREYLQDSRRDFCGHRREAIEGTDRALNQLRIILENDRAEVTPTERVPTYRTVAWREETSAAAGPYDKIRAAFRALENARADLQHAHHDFHGHKAEALESINYALRQLHLAIDCGR